MSPLAHIGGWLGEGWQVGLDEVGGPLGEHDDGDVGVGGGEGGEGGGVHHPEPRHPVHPADSLTYLPWLGFPPVSQLPASVSISP